MRSVFLRLGVLRSRPSCPWCGVLYIKIEMSSNEEGSAGILNLGVDYCICMILLAVSVRKVKMMGGWVFLPPPLDK